MSFSFKETIYKFIDNQIEILWLEYLNKQELNKLINALKFNRYLKRIILLCCQLEDLTSLCKVLKNNSCLEVLSLTDNKIKDIAPLLKFLSNSCLKTLQLFNNEIEEKKIFVGLCPTNIFLIF